MGVESKKIPPLPAPTETESLSTPTELATDVSKAFQDEKSSFSLPDDGTPVTIKTRGHKPNRSQTSLLIEYFEGGNGPGSPEASSSSNRRPSVRVRLTPSKTRGKNDHIQITEMKSTRKASLTRRVPADSATISRSDLDVDPDDTRSMNSYASATEESNVSRQPIEVEITPGHHRRRERKVSSPLIPAADSKASSYMPPNMSDISAIPTDSFLDGSGGNTTFSREERDTKSSSRGEALAAGALGAVAAAAVADKMNRKGRSASHDRRIMEKAVEKASKPERKQKSKSRTSSISEKDIVENKTSPRRRSKGTHKDPLISAADSSILSSQMTPSHKSYESHSSSKVSINNPKLLETVEDAIRRLILPELDALKRERSKRDSRRSNDRESLSSLTSVSREEISTSSKRKSGETTHSTKSRGREARNDLSPHSSVDGASVVEEFRDDHVTPRRGKLADAALLGGAALAGAAVASAGRDRSRTDEERRRRRRRAKTPERGRASEEFEEVEHEVIPPMPLSSEINPSEMTRTSILSADTDRPHSASEEMNIHEVSRGVGSLESMRDTPTPTRTPAQTLRGLGAAHANISHGDLKALPRKGPSEFDEYEESEISQMSQKYPHPPDEYDEEYDEAGHLAEPGMYETERGVAQDFYNTQDVPSPLRYVPYQQERRGLSPIPSVSGYTEGDSEVHHQRRDSRATHSEFSSPEKSPHHDMALRSASSIPSNMRSREFGDEESSLLSSGNYRNTMYTDDGEDGVASRQAVRGLGANPEFIEQPMGAESHVASLIDGSVMEPSVLSDGQGHRDSQLSYDDGSHLDSQLSYDDGHHDSQQSYGDRARRDSELSFEQGAREQISGGNSPGGHLVDGTHHDVLGERHLSPESSRQSRSNASREFVEYDIDEYGQKVPRTSQYRHSPSASEAAAEAAITSAALGRAAALAMMAKNKDHPGSGNESISEERYGGDGVSRNRSFKERAKEGYQPNATPRHSADRLSDYDRPRMGVSGLPDVHNPMPEIGYGFDEAHKSPSIIHGPLGGSQHGSREEWHEEPTPTQEKTFEFDRAATPKASEKGSHHGLGLSEAAAAATLATAGALVASHSRQPSQEQDDEWQRTSGDRKRDTLITNPYEGTSPIANLPGLDGTMLGGGGLHDAYRGGFNTGSPGLPQGDEGYISAAPNDNRDGQMTKGKGVDFLDQPGLGGGHDDPFYVSMPKHTRHLSGLSQGMGSPLYDASTGTGIDRIQSKDIVALMEHLMVRDAQRSARDTEMLVTLVRSAAEMRNSFNDIKRLLADSEDQIIGEVKDNTEKTVQRHLGGPRPLPGSGSRSLQGGSQSGTLDDLPARKRNFLRRALKGLGAKGTNDLGRIEEMLMQLLTEVDVLKHQTAVPGAVTGMSTQNQSLDNLPSEMQYEQDRGYEPEGHAGTSTASHASQSGHLSIPQSRGTSLKTGYDRKFSDHRISTVHEDDEDDEYENPPMTRADQYTNEDYLNSPAAAPIRGGSVPLSTPPMPAAQATNASLSNENTPLTDGSKKHKSRGSTSFFPKISRWSETTTSSLGKVFRSSGGNSSRKPEHQEEFLQHPPSRSGSDLNDYDHYQDADVYGDDKLHTGFSEQDLPATSQAQQLDTPTRHQFHEPPPAAMYATPEDPKYKAHRNSLNLQHPQPRPGQTERFRTALESSAQEYDSSMSPKSADWAGSATSLHRFPGTQQTQRYSDQSAGDEYNRWVAGSNGPSPSINNGPPRPPKEPLEASTPPRNERVNKLQKKQSPLPYHSVESGYGTATQAATSSYHSGSPRLENRNLSGVLGGAPTRRPSGPRAMTPSKDRERLSVSRGSEGGESVRSASGEAKEMMSASGQSARDERRRKRDTFGTVTSQDSETF